MDLGQGVLLGGGGILAGAVNAAAGGGSLISYPALLGAGLPALAANVTNTVALCPGYLGGLRGFRRQLEGPEQRARLRRLTPVSVIGAGIGVVLLQASSTHTFRDIVPWLILFACALFGVQPLITRRLVARRTAEGQAELRAGALAAQGATSAYGAYFGAAAGVIMLASLGLAIDDDLARINAIKSWLQLVMNGCAAIAFVFISPVRWVEVAVLAPCALIGGRTGAALSLRIPATLLRAGVTVCGVTVALVLLLT
ncbi:MAG TPA: sulfite exporter TauE/SafE family protein [Solirubrobacteraceae bacterium]|jgi:hypothetical protein|nr:sulfite exporter TauE/SafE family protein [Solirubrobacteraceae bacterium]